MRFSVAAAAALFGAALAAPADKPKFDPREQIVLRDFEAAISPSGDKNVTSIKFNILAKRDTGDKTFVCSGTTDTMYGPHYPTTNCEGGWRNDAFRFSLRSHPVKGQFDLTVFHQTADAFGSWGDVTVKACCDAKNVCLKDETKAELHFYE